MKHKVKHVHFVGIGGSGMSGIAEVMLNLGFEVSGSDIVDGPAIQRLRMLGAKVHVGHAGANVSGANAVVTSTAVKPDNPEVAAARNRRIPVVPRAMMLAELMRLKQGIAIAGTHGKTTTTAMTAWVLHELGRDPSFIIGGVMNNLGVNAHAGKGNAFVIEADEYDNMFLGLKPQIAVVTSLEHDHPDMFPTLEAMYASFEKFVDLLPEDGTLIICAEDAGAAALIPHVRQKGINHIAYYIQNEMTISSPYWVMARAVKANKRGGFDFVVSSNLSGVGLDSVEVSLQVPGRHNVRNALAVFAIADFLGMPREGTAKALGKFTGTGRRFQLRGEANGISVYDDYAHHPTEIKATLEGARARFPDRKIWAVWQPHTYSRTQTLFLDFTRAFKDADEVIVTEVYAAREPKQEFTSAEVVSAMPHRAARFIATLPEVTSHLLRNLKPGDVVIVMSAGDADQISSDLVKAFQER